MPNIHIYSCTHRNMDTLCGIFGILCLTAYYKLDIDYFSATSLLPFFPCNLSFVVFYQFFFYSYSFSPSFLSTTPIGELSIFVSKIRPFGISPHTSRALTIFALVSKNLERPIRQYIAA